MQKTGDGREADRRCSLPASIYGHRARIAVIVPDTNTVNEAEWSALRPAGVSVHVARAPLHGDGAREKDGISAGVRNALQQLSAASPAALAYACTADSMTLPVDTMPAALSACARRPCTTTAFAIVEALRHLQVETVSVATPYAPALDEHERDFLQALGFRVTGIRGLGIGAGGPHEYSAIARLSLDEVYEHAVRSFEAAPADALLLSCTDLPTLPLIPGLEERFQVPVISSNTATLWHTLQLTMPAVPYELGHGGVLLRAVRRER